MEIEHIKVLIHTYIHTYQRRTLYEITLLTYHRLRNATTQLTSNEVQKEILTIASIK